jgi:FAD/FMN-containing dehydrogenase
MTGHRINRRTALAVAGAAIAHDPSWAKCPTDPLTICNVTELYSIKAAQVRTVQSADDIRQALRQWQGPVSVGGGRFSMGGQTAISNGMQLDMRGMNKLVHLDSANKIARVQSGMTWRQLQERIDPHGLSVRTMQSYANFTVGGSVSVNCHGRYVGHGAISHSVRALQLITPYGEVMEVSPQKSPEIFYAALGGYGGIGIITEVELSLDDNHKIKRVVERVPLADYAAWFKERILSNPDALLHNADLTPPGFDAPLATTWYKTQDELTIADKLIRHGEAHHAEKWAIWSMTEMPGGKKIRSSFDASRQLKPAVVWRNFEASLDVAELEPYTRNIATYVLQEYFIPERHFLPYTQALSKLMRSANSHTLNISIRHAPKDARTLMSWGREDVFAFVVYYKQRLGDKTQTAVADWTRAMIALALKHEGSYYLPYQLHATADQFRNAYPHATRFSKLRKDLQAQRLTNTLWSQYNV